MTKRLVIAALVLAVAAGLWVLTQGWQPGQRPAGEAQWPSLAPEAVQGLRFELPEPGFDLAVQGDDWSIRPLAAAAKPGPEPKAASDKVAALLESVARNKPKRALGAYVAKDAKAYGLDAPRVRLRIGLRPAAGRPGQGEVVLVLGRETPAGDGVYALNSLAPDTLFVVEPTLLRQLEHPAEFYVDTRLFEIAEKDVAQLRLAGPSGPRFEVVRKDGGYAFVRPAALAGRPASESAFKQYLRSLLSLKAAAFLPAKAVAGRPLFVVEVSAGGAAAPEILEVFQAEGKPGQLVANATAQPGFFVLDREQAALLDRPAFDLQDRSVVGLDIGKIESLHIQFGSQAFVAEKTNTGWLERGGKRDVLGIDMSLWRFNELKFEAEPLGVLPSTAAWTMTCEPMAADGRVVETLTFYSDPRLPAGRCWVRVGTEKIYSPVSEQLLKDLQGLFPVKK